MGSLRGGVLTGPAEAGRRHRLDAQRRARAAAEELQGRVRGGEDGAGDVEGPAGGDEGREQLAGVAEEEVAGVAVGVLQPSSALDRARQE
jgi:hypothetical protein